MRVSSWVILFCAVSLVPPGRVLPSPGSYCTLSFLRSGHQSCTAPPCWSATRRSRAAYGELDSHTCEAPDTLLKLPVFVCCSFLVLLVVIVSKLAATLPLKAGNTLLACLAGFPLPCVLLPAAVLLPGILPYCWPHDCL